MLLTKSACIRVAIMCICYGQAVNIDIFKKHTSFHSGVIRTRKYCACSKLELVPHSNFFRRLYHELSCIFFSPCSSVPYALLSKHIVHRCFNKLYYMNGIQIWIRKTSQSFWKQMVPIKNMQAGAVIKR